MNTTLHFITKCKCVRTVLFTLIMLHGYHLCHAQKITVNEDNKPVPDIIDNIGRQAKILIDYSKDIFKDIPRLSLHVKKVTALDALRTLLKGMELDVYPAGGSIAISRRVREEVSVFSPVKGRIVDENDIGMEGAYIVVPSTGRMAVAGKDGFFEVAVDGFTTALKVSHTGYDTMRTSARNTNFCLLRLQLSPFNLDRVEIRGYGHTTHRQEIADISRMKPHEFQWQPWVDVTDAMEGRISGLYIRQPSGVTGTRKLINVRGVSTLGQGTDPLIIIDGVPQAGGYTSLSKISTGSAQNIWGASGLNSISRENIASIDVLKDAAATAIYGSRGANGVILITTKQGRRDTTRWEVHVYTGINSVLKTSRLLSTPAYLRMRDDAVYNDKLEGLAPDSVYEDYQWAHRNTDYRNMTTGHTGQVYQAGLSVYGGDTNRLFYLSGNYYSISPAYYGDFNYRRATLYGNIVVDTTRKPGDISLTASNMLSFESNVLPIQDFFSLRLMAPNAPLPISNGQYVSGENGLNRMNIRAQQMDKYSTSILSDLGHVEADYRLLRNLTIKASLGYNLVLSSEEGRQTRIAQDISQSPDAMAVKSTAKSTYSSIIGEATAGYRPEWEKHSLDLLLGVSYQQEHISINSFRGEGYPSDMLMNIDATATRTNYEKSDTPYKYAALFARADYNFLNKYFLTGSMRTDMSGRFGKDNRRGVFWSLGAGWTFTGERWMKDCHWLSFGKLWGSIGMTGSDQVGEFSYGLYNPTEYPQGYQVFSPARPANAQLGWEKNKKMEVAIDLGFLHDRLGLTIAYYRHTADNLVALQPLASTTGFPGIMVNLPVVIRNRGLECMLQTVNLSNKWISWSTSFSLTMPESKLLKFPNFASSQYDGMYRIGKSLTEFSGYAYKSVGVEDGLYQFVDVNKDSTLDKNDFVPCGNFDPRWYAGMNNSFRSGGWDLSIFVQYTRQNGRNPVVELINQNIPGSPGPSGLGNVPIEMSHYWRRVGDVVPFQKVTTTRDSQAGRLIDYFVTSSAYVIDASFLRIKNVCLGYQLPASLLKDLGLISARFYLSAQNVLTLTRFPVTDPETQDPRVLPPMRTVIFGIQIKF